eukprot:TRINITY_DN20801_c0_g1_i1.p1 TRINITY_DN20801_c0_g1~~TRINITY_DN20801_c0_g1_i1.p1  ORF type:complete len:321 (+),score=29.66 TRINITY_DN20801_c0_g1_i1:77-1039(+)
MTITKGVFEEYELEMRTTNDTIELSASVDNDEWSASLGEKDVEKITKKSSCFRSFSEFKDLMRIGIQGGGCTSISICSRKELTRMYPSPIRQQSADKKRYLLLDYDMSYGRALYTIILKQEGVYAGTSVDPEFRLLKKENADLKKLNNRLYQRAKEDQDLMKQYDVKMKEQKDTIKHLKAELARLHRDLTRERERGRSMSRASRTSQRSESLTSNGSRGSRASYNSRNSARSRGSSQTHRATRPLPTVPKRRSPSIHSDDTSLYSDVSSRYRMNTTPTRRSYRRSPSSSDTTYPSRRTPAYMGSRDPYNLRRQSPSRRWR